VDRQRRWRLLWLFTLIIGLSGMLPSPTGGQERVEVLVVEGESPIIQNDVLQAKQRALEDALATAVHKVIGTFVSAESFSQNFVSIERSILTKIRGYVKNYTVLKEESTPEVVTLTVEVKVSVDPIRDDLTALGILLEAMGHPRVLILIIEEGSGKEFSSASASARELQSTLTSKGFNVVEPSTVQAEAGKVIRERAGDRSLAELIRLSKQAGADLLIFGKGVVQQLTSQGLAGLTGAVVQLETTTMWVETGKTVSTRSTRMNGVGPTPGAALDQAYGKTGQEMATQLLTDIVEKWSAATLNGREVTLRLEVADYARLQRFRKRLGRIFGVKKATQKSFAGTTATLEVTFTGSTEMLADLISSTTFPDLQVHIKAFAADQLQVEVQ
jgi:hypothetical protein